MISSAGQRLHLLVEVGFEAVAFAVDDAVLEPFLDRPARAVLRSIAPASTPSNSAMNSVSGS